MSLTGKLNAGMSSVVKTMKNGVDNCKLDGKIAEQQNKIKTLTGEIGNLVIIRLEAGDEMSPEIMERYALIQEARELIKTLEKEKKVTKSVCPKCGAKTSVSMSYCGKCGSSMENFVD